MDKIDNEKIDVDIISVPKMGGTYSGASENFQTEDFSGAISLNIPIYTSQCRNIEPKLNLGYNSSLKNGIFGMGFTINIPSISRNTENFIPTYNDNNDNFVSSEFGELTKVSQFESNEWTVTLFKYSFEKNFSKIEYLKNNENSYWKVTTKENTVLIFGYNKNSKIELNKNSTFKWLLEESIDKNGNKILYEYIEDDRNNHIKSIKYGNYFDELGNENFNYKVIFNYRSDRIDKFITYKSGFPIFTRLLCSKISMIHKFEGKHLIIREMNLKYDFSKDISLLSEVREIGYSYDKNGNIRVKNTPKICLQYNSFEPNNYEFKELSIKDGNLNDYLDKNNYTFVDLYGDGIEGILYNSNESVIYFRPLGNGCYDSPEVVQEFPIDKGIEKNKYTFASLKGNGKYNLVVELENRAGFYKIENHKFSKFVSFEKYSNQYKNIYGEFSDLQGDGLRHLFFSFKDKLLYYPSLSEKGMDTPVQTKPPEDFPEYTCNSENIIVKFLDILGDGIPHRVKITNGCAECWPNLGYGKFGEKLLIENFPYFGEDFDSSRLFFSDLDGSGTQDMIYIYSNKIDIFLNPCGLYFKEPISIELPETYTKNDGISFADVSGNGCKSIIFTKIKTNVKHYFLDLCSEIKPYLLKSYDNNKGNNINIKYKSSVLFYLEDKRNNVIWKRNIPFPVHVVSEIEKNNLITGLNVVTRYRYRHGYFDFEKRHFNGFAYIEKTELQNIIIQGKIRSLSSVYKKDWFYTGDFNENYNDEFNNQDKLSYDMPKPYFSLFKSKFIQKAHKALKGKKIREEIYCLDNPNLLYKAEEYNYTVRQLTELDAMGNISFYTSEREHINYQYDRCISDPVIEHNFILEEDEYGNFQKTCKVFYPRRIKEIEEQKKTNCELEIVDYINKNDEFMALGILKEYKKIAINGLESLNFYFDFYELKEKIDKSLKNMIPFGIEFDNLNLQSRLEKWEKYFYWDELQNEVLPIGDVSKHSLLHHKEEAVLSKEIIDINFSNYISKEMLENDCFYQLNQEYWWKCEPINYYYDAKCFFQKKGEFIQSNNKDYKSIIKYDKYSIIPTEYSRKLNNEQHITTIAEVDYNSINYCLIKDENNNITEFLYDPLGMVSVKTIYGTDCGNESINKYIIPGIEEYEAILLNPNLYVQNMSSYYFYDLCAFENRKQPISVIEISRENFYSDNNTSKSKCSVTFYDNEKVLEKRIKDDNNWLVKYRNIYDENKLEIVNYQPYFTDDLNYNITLENNYPVYKKYDVLNRIIYTEKPYYALADGSVPYVFSKVIYEPWREIFYDENDTVLDSDYYKEFIDLYSANTSSGQLDKMDAIRKSEIVYNTPIIKIFDNRHYKIAEILNNDNTNYFTFNNQKKVLTICDSRQKIQNNFNYKYIYDMLDVPICTVSCDTGIKITFKDIFNNDVHYFDSENNHKKFYYDNLNRHIYTYVDNIGITEKIIYGSSEKNNLNNHVYKHYSQMGIETFDEYDIQGNLISKTRQLCKNYKSYIDWSIEEKVSLEDEIFNEKFKYNSLSNKILYFTPKGSVYKYEYNFDGLLKKIIQHSEDEKENCLTSLSYAVNGKLKQIIHLNGLKINYIYDDVSLKLESLQTLDKNNKLIQKLKYIFDPVGNITKINNELENEYENQFVKNSFDFTYDASYQLIEANGREMPACSDKSDYKKLENYKETFCYDTSGNLTKIKHSSFSTNWVSNMEMNPFSNLLSRFNDYSFDYDKNGNMIKLPNTRKMNWNYDNQLLKIDLITREDNNSDSEYYVYDSSGARIRKITERKTSFGMEITEKIYFGDFEIKRIYQNEKLILDRNSIGFKESGNPILRSYIWYKDNLKRETDVINKIKNHYQSANLNCSVYIEADDNCEIISYEEYYPYGGTSFENVRIQSAPKKEYRYCGKERDDTSGLYYFESRYYCTYICRMISGDDVKYVDINDSFSINAFTYCKNNPVRYIDMDGHDPGDQFRTIDLAAADFAQYYYSSTEYSRLELASNIYTAINAAGNPYFSYTKAAIGRLHSVNPGNIPALQPGQIGVGIIHNHPNSPNFSNADKDYSDMFNIPIFVVIPPNPVTHSYGIKRYDPALGAPRTGPVTTVGFVGHVQPLSVSDKIGYNIVYYFKKFTCSLG